MPDTRSDDMRRMTATLRVDGVERTINGRGNGPIAIELIDYETGQDE